jgi:PAS domain S-box-containing protein
MTNEQYQQLVREDPDGVLIVDPEGLVQYANPAAGALFGRDPSELVGTTFGYAISTQSATAGTSGTETEIIGPEGAPIIVEVLARPLEWEGRESTLVSLRDVTARKEAEQQLADANRQLSRLNRALETITAINRLMFENRSERSLTYGCCKLLAERSFDYAWIGYSRSDQEQSIEVFAFAGEERPAPLAAEHTWRPDPPYPSPVNRAMQTGRSQAVRDTRGETDYPVWSTQAAEAGVRSALAIPLISDEDPAMPTSAYDGALLPGGRTVFGVLTVYAAQIYDFDEREIEHLGQLADDLAYGIMSIRTERALEASRAARRQAEEQYRTVLEGLAEGVAVVRNDRFLFWNPAIRQMTGLSKVELSRTRLTGLELADEESVLPGVLAAVEQHGRVDSPVTFRLRTGDGAERIIRATGTLIQWDRERAVLLVLTDITAERELEEQLQQAQKMQTVGQLVGGVAHDFNNILTAINGYISLLERKLGDDPETGPFVSGISSASERAGRLTAQLLAYSRRDVVRPEVVDVRDIAAESQKMLRRLLGEDIDFQLDTASRSCTVSIDPAQAEQLLMNLGVNARDAMPEGGQLRMEVTRVELERAIDGEVGPGTYVEITVADTGTGISPETVSQIFEPFYTTKESGRGTGLGLATVQSIVERNGGAILVRTAPGEGTTFRIYLPYLAEEQQESGEEGPSMELAGTETVLVVEDDDDVRLIASQTLRQLGYTVLVAENAEAARRQMREHAAEVSVVLSDVVLPGQSGPETVEELRHIGGEFRVIFTSGYTEAKLDPHGVLSADTSFLPKPFTADQLAVAVRSVLDGTDASSALAD